MSDPGVPNLAEPAASEDRQRCLTTTHTGEPCGPDCLAQPLSRDEQWEAEKVVTSLPGLAYDWTTIDDYNAAQAWAVEAYLAAEARVRADERRRVAEDLDQARADLAAIQSAIVRIHVQMPDHVAPRLGFEASDLCRADGERWPCPTIRALRPGAPAERVQDGSTDTAGTRAPCGKCGAPLEPCQTCGQPSQCGELSCIEHAEEAL